MIRTIQLSETIFVQGVVVGTTEDGRLSVRVGDKVFHGRPVTSDRAA